MFGKPKTHGCDCERRVRLTGRGKNRTARDIEIWRPENETVHIDNALPGRRRHPRGADVMAAICAISQGTELDVSVTKLKGPAMGFLKILRQGVHGLSDRPHITGRMAPINVDALHAKLIVFGAQADAAGSVWFLFSIKVQAVNPGFRPDDDRRKLSLGQSALTSPMEKRPRGINGVESYVPDMAQCICGRHRTLPMQALAVLIADKRLHQE